MSRNERSQVIRNSLPKGRARGIPRKAAPGAKKCVADQHSRLERIKREIQQGTYETREKLEIAMQRLLKELRVRRKG